MGKILQNISYVTAVYSAIGFLTLSYYYNHFNINIVAYISVYEIVLLSLPNFKEIGISLIFLVGMNLPFAGATYSLEKRYLHKENKIYRWHFKFMINLISSKYFLKVISALAVLAIIGEILVLSLIEQKIIRNFGDFGLFDKTVLCSMALFLLMIIFSFGTIVLDINHNIHRLFSRKNFIYVSIAICVLFTNLLFAYTKISDIESNKNKIPFVLFLEKLEITSEDASMIGESRDFIFLTKNKTSLILKKSDVDLISIGK